MSEIAKQKAFSKTEESLEGCQLSTSMTTEQSRLIGEILSVSEPWKSLSVKSNALANYLSREDSALYRYSISVKGELAGVICVRYPWLRGPYIELLGLFPDYRSKGIGRQLLVWAETEARKESKNLWVLTSSFNLRGLDFYQNFGFYPIGPIQGLVNPDNDEILLRKNLS